MLLIPKLGRSALYNWGDRQNLLAALKQWVRLNNVLGKINSFPTWDGPKRCSGIADFSTPKCFEVEILEDYKLHFFSCYGSMKKNSAI